MSMRLLCLLSACAVLLLSACSPRETPVQRGLREQTLIRGIGHELASLDPHLATQASDYNVLSALFEGLVAEDPQDLHPVPGVAESWDVSADGLVYTFHLRADARWSNGDPLTSDDFVASFRRALSPQLAAENAPMLYLLRGAEDFHKGRDADFSHVGATALDARTLRLTLAHPAPYFLAQLNHTIWFPVHLPTIQRHGSATDRANPWARPGRIVSNGPFALLEWKLGQRIVATKSPIYWDAARVRLHAIHFLPLDVDTEERAFRAGQMHITEALPPAKVETYRNETPSRLRVDPLLGTYFYRLNLSNPALQDARVRLALALALDRGAIVEKILHGGQLPAPAFTPPGVAGYTPPSGFTHQPDEARRLLAEAGFPGGAGLPKLELLFNSSETHRTIAEAVQEMWRRELGVEVQLTNMDNTSVLAARRTGSFQILRSVWTSDYVDPQSFLGIWTSDSGNNYTGWSDAAYDDLIRQAGATADNARRFSLLAQAEARLLASAPMIPVYHYTHVFAIHPAVRGWSPTLLDHHPYKHVWLEN
ncbi:MAG TPA: peptide ABC transporter substrate-binding protein [Opitutaceae bacterium]|nr:peptide ABC transporter substrate-binding protein [Opitutaceae bacterium]HQL21701.1 peptide ABC transporter substrate-binding protein [Opitutaceae bacterium]